MISSLIAVFLLIAGTSFLLFRPVVLRFAVVETKTEDVAFVRGIERLFSRKRFAIRISPIFVKDEAARAAILESGKADLAVVRASPDLSQKIRAVAIFRKNAVIGWTWSNDTKKARRLADLNDLIGNKVALLNSDETDVTSLKDLLSKLAVDPSKINFVATGPEGLSANIRDQQLKAAIFLGPASSKALARAVNDTAQIKGELVFLHADAADAIAQKYPIFEAAELPPGLFKTNPPIPAEKVDTLSVSDFVMARDALSEDEVGALTRQLFNARHLLLKEVPSIAALEPPDTGKSSAISVHPGTAAYIDGTERTFLDRYSDLMWGGLLLLSGLGTAGAWFRSYLLKSERDRNLSLREGLVNLLDQIPNATSLEQLKEMRSAADKSFRDTMTCFEDGAIDDASLTSFGLVLARFHHAISERSSELLSSRQSGSRKSTVN